MLYPLSYRGIGVATWTRPGRTGHLPFARRTLSQMSYEPSMLVAYPGRDSNAHLRRPERRASTIGLPGLDETVPSARVERAPPASSTPSLCQLGYEGKLGYEKLVQRERGRRSARWRGSASSPYQRARRSSYPPQPARTGRRSSFPGDPISRGRKTLFNYPWAAFIGGPSAALHLGTKNRPTRERVGGGGTVTGVTRAASPFPGVAR